MQKRAIYKGESTRHLLNCSSSADYDDLMSKLRHDLATRGYPSQPHIPYDIQKRSMILEKLRDRTRTCKSRQTNDNVVVFKTEYHGHVRHLKLREEINHLVVSLRSVIGDTFLRNARVVTAHTMRSNLFRRQYRYNIVPGSMGPLKRGFRVGGVLSGM